MNKLKKLLTSALVLTLLCSFFGAAACGNNDEGSNSSSDAAAGLEAYEKLLQGHKEKINLSVWTYYNNEQSIAFGKTINEFNKTRGKSKNIYVEHTSYDSVTKLTEALEASSKKTPGKPDMPQIFQVYSDDLKSLDDTYHNIASLDNYFTKSETENYVENFFEEGYINDGLKLIPTAKSTEVFMLNKTDWDNFETAYNAKAAEKDKVSLDDLKTIEGVTDTAEKYYQWSEGKAFFGRDALANYILTSAHSLGKTVIQPSEDSVQVILDKETFRRIYDNFYVPYVKGYFYSKERYRSGDVQTGNILSYVGSTSSATYFPKAVQIDDDHSYDIETYVAPIPVFKDAKAVAIQQGAGLAVSTSDTVTEYASAVFIKYLSENEDFAASMNYVPVLQSAYASDGLDKIQTAVINNEWRNYLEKEEKGESDFTAQEIAQIKSDLKASNKILLDTYKATYETMTSYEVWASFPYENSAKIRKIFEYALTGTKPSGLGMENLKNASDLLALVEQRVKNGETRSQAAEAELAAYPFENWFNELSGIVAALG